MKKFVAVIGPRTAGKTTIIRSLTGCKTMCYRGWIADNFTGRLIFVIAASPQEKPMSLAEFRRILDQVARTTQCTGIVAAFQPRTPRGGLGIEDFFQELDNEPSFEKYAFILNPSRDNTPTDAQAIHTRLDRFAPAFHQLDARRFCHLNAAQIQALTHIVD
jgi:hypothetical protein